MNGFQIKSGLILSKHIPYIIMMRFSDRKTKNESPICSNVRIHLKMLLLNFTSIIILKGILILNYDINQWII